MHRTHSACKSKDKEYVTVEQMRLVKERINHAIDSYAVLFEETQRRDHVIAESLAATQLGKNNRLIVKKNVHDTLNAFINKIKGDCDLPELNIPMLDFDSDFSIERGRKRKPRSASNSRKKIKRRSQSKKSEKSSDASLLPMKTEETKRSKK